MDACLFCGNIAVQAVDRVASTRLVDVFAQGYGADVQHLFQSAPDNLTLFACAHCALRWFSPQIIGDAEFYECLQKFSWYYQDDKPEYGYAKNFVERGDAVLEVGCGKGAFSAALGQGVRYRGLEFNRAAVDKARAQGLDVEARTIEHEAQAAPAHYDVVCHFQVLEHVSNPRQFLVDCIRTLKPGGRLVVAVPAEDSFLNLAQDSWLNMPPHHLTRWTDAALLSAVEQLGIDTLEVWHEPVATYHAAWYREVMIRTAIDRLLGRRPTLAASRWQHRRAKAMRILARTLGLENLLFERGERGFPYRGRGHTVCLVGRKRVSDLLTS